MPMIPLMTDAAEPHMLIDRAFVVSCAACGRLGDWLTEFEAMEVRTAHREFHRHLARVLESREIHLAEVLRRYEAGEADFDRSMRTIGRLYELEPLPTWTTPTS